MICLNLSNTVLMKNLFSECLGDSLVKGDPNDGGLCGEHCSVHLPLPASPLICRSTVISASYQLFCVKYSIFLCLIVNCVIIYLRLSFAICTNIVTFVFEWLNCGQYEVSDLGVFFLHKKMYVIRNYLILSYRA